MPRLIFSSSAQRDLERLKEFLFEQYPTAVPRFSSTLAKAFESLVSYPKMGRCINSPRHIYRIVVPFGRQKRSYIIHYYYFDNEIIVIRVKHSAEKNQHF